MTFDTLLQDTTAVPPLRTVDFDRIRQLIYDRFGIDLRGKQTLVSGRLQKKIRELHLRSFADYFDHVQNDSSGAALTAMVDALTTNHTSFFREVQHFKFLREIILPRLGGHANLSIWSAACSTGEEPYSIAFTLLEELGTSASQRARILATDVSTRALRHAEHGVFAAERFENVPHEQMRRHLLKGSGDHAGKYLVKEEARSLVRFQQLNLMEDFSHLGSFSVIFCRNVMIYFDKATQENLVNRLAHQLVPGGYLLTGHAESLNGVAHQLEYVCPATYRKPQTRPQPDSRRSNRECNRW